MAAAVLYAVFARGGAIQEEFSASSRVADLRRVVEQILYAMPKGFSGQKSYEHEGYTFNYVVDRDVVMLAVNSSAAHNRAAFALLQKLVDQFNTMKDPGAFKLYFNKELEGFNKAPPASDPKIREVQEKLDSVTGIMRGNIDKVLERGDRLEVVLDKSETLASSANMFRSRSVDLRRKLCFANARVNIILVIIVIFVGLFIALSVCGITFKACTNGDSNTGSS